MTRFLTCWKTARALRAYIMGTLPEKRRKSVARHLEGCPACRVKHTRERGRLQLLGNLRPAEAPTGLADRTLARIRGVGDVPNARAISIRYLATKKETSYTAWAAAAVLLLVLSAAGIWALGDAREAARRASTQNTMKQLALAFKMAANQSEASRWPSLTDVPGVWSPDVDVIYREFLNDPQLLVSEEHPARKELLESLREALDAPQPDYAAAERLMGESYAYLGYAVDDIRDFEALFYARADGQLPDDGSPIPETGSTEPVPALREGVERFLITDINNPASSAKAQSTIPVLVEIASWKYKKSAERFKGTHVLYMDGHVDFVTYGTFPVVEEVLNALAGLPQILTD